MTRLPLPLAPPLLLMLCLSLLGCSDPPAKVIQGHWKVDLATLKLPKQAPHMDAITRSHYGRLRYVITADTLKTSGRDGAGGDKPDEVARYTIESTEGQTLVLAVERPPRPGQPPRRVKATVEVKSKARLRFLLGRQVLELIPAPP